MWASSVCSERRNFFRAGTLKKRSRTVMVVPGARATSSERSILPPATSTRVPVASSEARVSSRKRDTEAMEGRASPRNPRVAMERRSFTSRNLLVAWRSKASMASSRSMPEPSSTMRMRRRPPVSISMRKDVAPASREFSKSSFTTDAGRSTTSPAAILLATWSGRTRMRPIESRCQALGARCLGNLSYCRWIVSSRRWGVLSWSEVSSVLSFHLPQYEGPLDLLLDLIRSQKIDIRDIPIAQLTAQYFEYMEKARQMDRSEEHTSEL